MKLLISFIVTFSLAFLYSIPCLSAGDSDWFFKYGVGINDASSNSLAATKMFTTGYRAPLLSLIDYQLETGAFLDTNQSQGVIYFASPSVGFRTRGEGLFLGSFIGPAFVSSTDTRLSSIFEFNNDLEIGLRDSRGLMLGVDYKHMSNGGLVPPNDGRDFFLIKIGLPIN